MKPCTICGETKPFSDYYTKGKKVDGSPKYCSDCKDCQKQIKRKGYNPEVKRERDLMKKFGLTTEAFSEMLERQGGKCAICQTSNFNFSHGKRPHVDHDHTTGKVRGLLCGKCNVALGHARDDVKILESAINYLKKHQ